MASSATGVRSPGRPREFGVDDVLDRAIEVFRERGYEASSMADIERATGLNTSSIYNTFGSKEALFKRSLSRYESVRLAAIVEGLAAGTAGPAYPPLAPETPPTKRTSGWGAGGG